MHLGIYISNNYINPITIDALIDVPSVDLSIKITRFSSYLRQVLPGIDPSISIAASRALGKFGTIYQ